MFTAILCRRRASSSADKLAVRVTATLGVALKEAAIFVTCHHDLDDGLKQIQSDMRPELRGETLVTVIVHTDGRRQWSLNYSLCRFSYSESR